MTAADPTIGAVLADRYRLEARIGRGGMAEVYRAQDLRLDRTVAVKLFRFDTADSAEQARMDAEMRTLARLRHPGLVTLFDASAARPGSAPFLVMEYVDGPTLSQRLAAGPLPPAEVAGLGAELAAALGHVHDSGIVHRDIKPANILLDEHTDPPVPKLADFGIARITDGTRITADGMTIGTANYLSPEQARGSALGPASDIYSLALVLIECLTGQVAFPGTGIEAAAARLGRPPEIPLGFGPQWAALLTAMTALDPAQRPSAPAAAQGLERLRADAATVPMAETAALATVPLAGAALGGAAAAGGTELLSEPAAERRRRRLPLLVGAAVLAVAGVVALAAALGSPGPTNGVPTGRPSPSHSASGTPRRTPGHRPRAEVRATRTVVVTRPAAPPAPKPPAPKPPAPKPHARKPPGPKPHAPKPPAPKSPAPAPKP